METVLIVAAHVLKIVLAVASPFIAILLGRLLHKLAIKVHLEGELINSQQVEDAAGKAIAFAENYANTKALTMTGNQKLDLAIQTVEGIVGQPAVQQYSKEALAHWINGSVAESNVKAAAPADAPIASV